MQHIVFSIKMHLSCKPVKKEMEVGIWASVFCFPTHLDEHKVLLKIHDSNSHNVKTLFSVCMYRSLPMYSFLLSAIIDFGEMLCYRILGKPTEQNCSVEHNTSVESALIQ